MPTDTYIRRHQPRWTLAADQARAVLQRSATAVAKMPGRADAVALVGGIDGASRAETGNETP
jgi:hypothetical protein